MMRAGFARAVITPPVGTAMMGFGTRDMERGCDAVHDDIFARVLYLEDGAEKALVIGLDLCFVGRADADRLKGAIGRHMDVLPRAILINASHSHSGPRVGTWHYAGYVPPDRPYLDRLEDAVVRASCEARDAALPVRISAGATRTRLPMNRRRRVSSGAIENRPNPEGRVYDRLPACRLDAVTGGPVCLLFSASCHPSMMTGWEISAEYPGAAARRIDERLGTPCALFLQGVGGDAKPRVIGEAHDVWQAGTWDLMEQAGAMVADETARLLDQGLDAVPLSLKTASVESEWPLQRVPDRTEFEAMAAETPAERRLRDVRHMWARRMIDRLDRGELLPDCARLTIQTVQIAQEVRLVALEGEAVADWGFFIEKHYGHGVTFPLGYSNGEGLYLPTTAMLDEGGMEVESYWEYGYPAPLAPGMEQVVRDALVRLQAGLDRA